MTSYDEISIIKNVYVKVTIIVTRIRILCQLLNLKCLIIRFVGSLITNLISDFQNDCLNILVLVFKKMFQFDTTQSGNLKTLPQVFLPH